MAAIGTLPRRILSLHVVEGFLLGVMGAACGTVVGTGIVWALGVWKIRFAFGRQEGLLLEPTLAIGELATVSLLVIGVSVLASLQPAWKASRMEPIEALRHL